MDRPWTEQPITFEAFMEHCLYHPRHGYYVRNDRPVFGRRGDYLTSPHTHRIFAQILARALASWLHRLDRGGALDLVELGAGSGRLAADLLESLRQAEPELSRRIRYSGVDVRTPELPREIRGVIFSNEFFDALPVHRVRMRDGRLHEIGVMQVEGAIREVELPLPTQVRAYMRRAFSVVKEGWTYEVNLRMLDLLGRLNERLQEGVIVTIDYGYQRSEYEARERPDGTLLCYRRHQVHADPYAFIGDQDITAHVHFDLVIEEGRRLGWRDYPLQTQREFLMQWGLAERLLEEERLGLFQAGRLEERLRLKDLLAPDGVSDRLKVLLQTKSPQ